MCARSVAKFSLAQQRIKHKYVSAPVRLSQYPAQRVIAKQVLRSLLREFLFGQSYDFLRQYLGRVRLEKYA